MKLTSMPPIRLYEKVMVKEPVLSVKFVSHTPNDNVPPGAFKVIV